MTMSQNFSMGCIVKCEVQLGWFKKLEKSANPKEMISFVEGLLAGASDKASLVFNNAIVTRNIVKHDNVNGICISQNALVTFPALYAGQFLEILRTSNLEITNANWAERITAITGKPVFVNNLGTL